jgi:hypothetical protein
MLFNRIKLKCSCFLNISIYILIKLHPQSLDLLLSLASSNFGLIFILLRISDFDNIGEWVSNTEFTGRIIGQHDSDLDTHNTLLETDVSDGNIHIVKSGLTRVNHISGLIFHGLSSLLSELTRDNDFTTSGTFLEDVSHDGSGSHSNWNTLQELEFHEFSLSSSAHTLLSDAGDLKFNGISFISESLLDQRGEFSDSETILTKNLGDLGGLNSDFSLDWGNSDFDTSITLEGE